MPVIKILLTDKILKVIKAYEDARDKDIAASVVFPAVQKEKPSIGADAASGAAEATGAALLGQLGGWKGTLIAGVVGAAGGAIKSIKNRFAEGQPEIAMAELSYLEEEQFPLNNENLDPNEIKDLQERYNNVLHYQELKKSRGFFLGLGKNYKEDEINDPKYFIAILIGRKLKAAANASTRQKYETELAHLNNFIQEIAAKYSELFDSNSDDTTYLSLRTLVIWLKERHYKADEIKNQTDNNKKRLEDLMLLVKDIHHQAEDTFTDCWKLVRNSATDYKKSQFDLYKTRSESPSQKSTKLNELKADSTFIDLFENYENQSPIKEEVLKKALAKAANVNESIVTSEMARAFQDILDSAAKIKYLSSILQKIMKLKTSGGNLAIIKVLPDINILTEEMKQSIILLKSLQNNFFKAITPLYSNSSSPKFKNNFARYAFLPFDHEALPMFDEAKFLTGLLTDSPNLEDEIKADIHGQIVTIHQEVEALRSNVPNPQSLERLAQENEINKDAMFDDFMRDVVIVDMEKSLAAGKLPEIPEPIKKQIDQHKNKSWFQLFSNRLSAENELRAKLEAERAENGKLQTEKNAEILELKTRLDELQNEKERLVHQRGDLNNQKLELEAKNGKLKAKKNELKLLSAKSDMEGKLLTLVNNFTIFLNDYKHNTRSGFLGIFSAHGNKGRQNAKKFADKFTKAMLAVVREFQTKEDYTLEKVKLDLDATYKQLLNNYSHLLVGNYKAHSFKTYLLAYHQYLTASLLNTNSIQATLTPETYLAGRADVDKNETDYLAMMGKTKPMSLHIVSRL